MPSSPIATLVDQLPPDSAPAPTPKQLQEVLATVPDPRHRRGVRHRFTGILIIAVCAVLAGARSFAAIAEWAADTGRRPLAQLDIGVPDSSTIRRALNRADAGVFDAAIGSWVRAQADPRIIAIDGKEVRGAKNGDRDRVHLMAALDHDTGTVIGQVDVGVKTNEIPRFDDLLDGIGNLREVIVSADAMHTQTRHAEYLHQRGAHYVLTVKGNQKSLQAQLRALPWKDVPDGDRQCDRGHGRVSIRRIKTVSIEPSLV